MRQTPNIDLNLFDSTDEIEVDSRLAFNENFEKLDIEAGKTDEMYSSFSQAITQLNMYGGQTVVDAGELKSAQANKITIGAVEKSVPAEVIALSGYGHSAGTVYNSVEWVDGRAYFHQRVDERAYASGDEDDTTVLTDGTNTYYPITEVVTEITNLFPSNFNIFASAGETSFEFVDTSIAWEIPYNSENATKIFADRILYDADDSGLTADNVQGAIDILSNEIDITSEFNLGTSGLTGAMRAYYTPALRKVHGVIALQSSSVINTTTPYLTVSQTYRPQEVKRFPILVMANDGTWLPYYMQIDINGQITQKLTATSKGIYGYFEYNI